jgi:hypothetical protein
MLTNALIDAIRGLLAGRPANAAGEVLAVEYAKQCRDVNGRLGKIALMLEGGGEIQALQLAEQSPPVVDAALALSFGGEAAWQDYCRDHGHELAPVIDARSLESLLAVQSKGLASNHPLYRDYRAAVSSRDDERAHNLIRVIARLNPGDENAAKELKRLQRKALLAAVANLRDNLDADGASLLAAMQKVEEAGAAEDYEKLPEWQRATDARHRLRQTAAWQRMPEVLRLAEQQLAQGEWRQAAVLHGEYGMLVGTYGSNAATAGLAERARALGVELDHHRAEAARAADVRQLVAQMERSADEIETKLALPAGLTPAAAAPMLEDLTRKVRQHESLHGDFPDGVQERIEAALARLAQVLARAKRRQRLRFVIGFAVAAVVVLAIAGLGLLTLRASNHTALLASLRGQETASGVRDLLTRILRDEPWLLKWPRLSTEVAQASRWLEALDTSAAIADRELTDLETARRQEFAALSSPDLHAKLQAIESLVAKLPAEVSSAAAVRLTMIRNDGGRALANRQQQNDAAARELATRWTAILAGIDLAAPVADAAEISAPAAAELAPFLELAAADVPILGLPAATAAMIADVDAKVRRLQEQVAAVASAVTGLQQATTPAAYRDALTQLAACAFAEGAAAQRVIAGWPPDDKVKALLVFRGDVRALEAAAKDEEGKLPVPAAVDARDREILAKLTSSQVLNNLWEVVWKNGKGVQLACLGQGEVERNGKDGWKGLFAPYPQLASAPLKFKGNMIPAAGGNVLVANRPTATTAMMAKLKLAELLNADGTEFRMSVLPLLDTVANDAQAKPLAKAYVLGHLFRLVQNHPASEWGLHYRPELIDEMNAFRELELKVPVLEAAWLLEKDPDYAKPWEAFFAARGKKWGFEEMRKTREAAAAVLQHPVELAGRAGPDGILALTPADDNRLLLAVCDAGGSKQELRVVGIAKVGVEPSVPSPAALPFSPLLTIALTDDLQTFLLSLQPQQATTNPQPQPAQP